MGYTEVGFRKTSFHSPGRNISQLFHHSAIKCFKKKLKPLFNLKCTHPRIYGEEAIHGEHWAGLPVKDLRGFFLKQHVLTVLKQCKQVHVQGLHLCVHRQNDTLSL